MPPLPVISGARCIEILAGLGCVVARVKGSHVRLRCPGRKPVTVPLHDELDRGTLRAILRSIGVSVAEFLALMKG
ncbi:MAG: type II toxin-antitoxin system HicA family toxin [Dehalogenimonas sp.]|uniref:Type II toxin-antitoxin system HicA family toxin n=1 Tax=Candidatus Dehalogenimonas loeffleri TaxID=3127115 RepID=A0ABZ2J4W1_9CHLR|nr:type II toxin-antitoxin system HicA family toxin [Dehalogenimonas sp.]